MITQNSDLIEFYSEIMDLNREWFSIIEETMIQEHFMLQETELLVLLSEAEWMNKIIDWFKRFVNKITVWFHNAWLGLKEIFANDDRLLKTAKEKLEPNHPIQFHSFDNFLESDTDNRELNRLITNSDRLSSAITGFINELFSNPIKTEFSKNELLYLKAFDESVSKCAYLITNLKAIPSVTTVKDLPFLFNKIKQRMPEYQKAAAIMSKEAGNSLRVLTFQNRYQKMSIRYQTTLQLRTAFLNQFRFFSSILYAMRRELDGIRIGVYNAIHRLDKPLHTGNQSTGFKQQHSLPVFS